MRKKKSLDTTIRIIQNLDLLKPSDYLSKTHVRVFNNGAFNI
jgi:hypothetical protein